MQMRSTNLATITAVAMIAVTTLIGTSDRAEAHRYRHGWGIAAGIATGIILNEVYRHHRRRYYRRHYYYGGYPADYDNGYYYGGGYPYYGDGYYYRPYRYHRVYRHHRPYRHYRRHNRRYHR